MAKELEGKVALVTGGAQGIGFEIGRKLSANGAIVILGDMNLERAQSAAAKISAETGQKAEGVQANVTNSADVTLMVNNALDKFKHIDILVNNAGITRDQLLLRMSEEDFDAVLSTNLKGAFLCSKAVSRSMIKTGGGSIISIGSVVGLNGNPGQANYAASKAALVGFSKTVAKELASRLVRANVVAPGFIRTAMTDSLSEQARASLLAEIPLARFGEAGDIAEAVLFLASDRSSYMTGQVLRVDGGMMM